MDAGAALVAFITIGLQSAKIIFDVLSAIKDGPKVVAQATRDIQKLGMVLRALEPQCLINQIRGQELHQYLQECTIDLAGYETQLMKLTICDKERHLGKLWKKARTAFNERDLHMMQSSVATHIAHLNLYLQVCQFDSCFELQKRVEILSETFQSNRSNDEGQRTAIFGSLSSINQRITSIEDVLGEISSNLNRSPMPTVSREIHEQLDRLTQLSIRLINSRELTETSVEDKNLGGWESLPPGRSFANLQRSVSRLCDLVNGEIAQMPGQQPLLTSKREVLDTILEFWGCIHSQAHQAQLTYHTMMVDNPEYDPHDQEHLEEFRNQLKPFYGALLSARSVLLNSLRSRKRNAENSTFSTHVLGLWRLTKISYDASFATLDIVISERCKMPHNASPTEQISTSEVTEHEVSYFVIMIPKKLCSIMTLRLKQYYTLDGIISGIPSLQINRMAPNSSPIFRFVARGEISDVQQLLIRGEASLRDHDELGASLLQYASLNHQAGMCQFLIKNGADIDHFAPIQSVMRGKNWPNWTSHHQYGIFSRGPGRHGVKIDGNAFKRHMECYKVLLSAGADPTSTLQVFDSALSCAFLRGELETMQCFLDHGEIFADLNYTGIQPDGWERSLFHLYCSGGNFKTEGFQSLIRRGADLDARDIFGRTCLHFCVSGPNFGNANRQAQIEALVYLAEYGADITKTDTDGNSVSQTAYLNSRAGDIWDVVLAKLGYEVSRFRRDCPRRAEYTEDYTPADFMKLWQGKEEICPYYKDDDLLELCRQFESRSLSEWRTPSFEDYDPDCDSNYYSDSDDSSDGGVLIK